MSESFVVERYLVARRIWKQRSQKAHDGFAATDKRGAVPAQTWAEWFEWAYGMSLADYAKTAEENKHGELVAKLGAVRAEYLIGSQWSVAIGVPGETFEELSASLHHNFPQIQEVRPRD